MSSNMTPDVFVLLPGLIGSVLSKDGKPIWGLSPGAMWDVVAGDALKRLEVAADDDGRDDLGDGIEATGLIPNPELIPGLWKQAGYSRLSNDLVRSLNLEKGKNFFEFAYDWRRDNRVSARRLARLAHDWLARWREASGDDDAKLVLIAHSMGGLVARYFIECLEGWRDTRALVSFGTPYRGSGNAAEFLSNGFKWTAGPFEAFDGTDALRSFQSVYQLLPIYPFIEIAGNKLSRVTDVVIPNVDRSRASAAAAFHAEVREAVAANLRKDLYRVRGPKVRPVVGIEQPTIQSAKLGSRLEAVYSYEGENLMGDGTVPRVSAIPIEADDDGAMYVATTHSALQSVDGALAHLRGVITGKRIDLDKYRRRDNDAGAITLRLADVYNAKEPVRIEAATSSYVQSLVATVERIDVAAEVWTPILTKQQDGYRTELELPPGLFRASVSRNGFQTVSDIFLVGDASQVSEAR